MTNEKPNIYKLCQDMGELRGQIDQMNATINRIMENHGKRINILEKITDQAIGRKTIFNAMAGFIGGIVVVIISYFINK